MKIKSQFSTPILFLIFNRPTQTKKVFEKIREVQPKQLFVAADGPRDNNMRDNRDCFEARECIGLIDWNCEVKTLFRDDNLGCREAVSTAIDWFFKHVDEGIILEDDCLPASAFFTFCQEMLARYRCDDEVMHISGNNYQIQNIKYLESHYFSKIPHIWGWATWQNTWKKYDSNLVNLKSYISSGKWRSIDKDLDVCNYWIECFYNSWTSKVDSWDYQWCFSIHLNNGLSITPNENLVENIGFDQDATHTRSGESPKLKQKYILNGLSHEVAKQVFSSKDLFTYLSAYNIKKKNLFLPLRLRKIIRKRYKCKRMRREINNSL